MCHKQGMLCSGATNLIRGRGGTQTPLRTEITKTKRGASREGAFQAEETERGEASRPERMMHSTNWNKFPVANRSPESTLTPKSPCLPQSVHLTHPLRPGPSSIFSEASQKSLEPSVPSQNNAFYLLSHSLNYYN